MIKHVFFLNHISKNNKLKSVYGSAKINPEYCISNATLNKSMTETLNCRYDPEVESYEDISESFVRCVFCSIAAMNVHSSVRSAFEDYWENIIIENGT